MTKKDTKESPKRDFNIKFIIKRLVKAMAFLVVFTLAAYGLRHMFNVMQEGLSIALTIGITLALGYIIFLDN